MFDLPETFSRLGVALGLGLLVGLQRQRTNARLAGFRTFPLVTTLGALVGLLAQSYGAGILAAALVGLALIIVGGNLPLLRAETTEPPGITTEVAMLVMFAVGAYLMAGSPAIATAVGGAVAVLLHLKPQMHTLAAKIGDQDFMASMQFVLISLVILPVLPNHYYGPFLVLNPFKIWLMVVLIVGLSLGGYVAYKFLGVRAGVWANGVLGGLISSTATTVSLARRNHRSTQPQGLAAFVILVASAIVFVRLAVLIGMTAPQFVATAAVPLTVMFALLALAGVWNLLGAAAAGASMPEPANPTELKPAIVFGLLYAGVLLAVAAARDRFGQGGLYAVAALSGLTDMDAITLSLTQLVNSGQITPRTGWRLIVIAAMANLAFKAGTVAILGNWRLFGRVALGFAVAAAGGTGLFLFWPG